MDDSAIIELFFARSEQAIRELDDKYGKVCYSLSYNIQQPSGRGGVRERRLPGHLGRHPTGAAQSAAGVPLPDCP